MTPAPPELRQALHEQTRQLWAAPGTVDLGIGQPQDAMLPHALLATAMARAATSGRRHPLQYGIEQGDGVLRAALADFLEPLYGVPVDPTLTLVTNGTSQAIDLCCGVLTEPGDVVLVEEPTYFLALGILRDHGLRVVGVPVDEQGLVPEALAEAADRHRPKLLYTVPAAHNPTGATLTVERRRRVVELAQEHGFVVVADEVYHLLDLDGGVPEPMAAHVGSGVVISLGTFSKILAPGLRLGWLQAAAPLLQRFTGRGFLVSGGGLNPFTSAVVADVLDDGSALTYLHDLRRLLRRRVDVMDAALHEHLPAASWCRPAGGYFFWLTFPEGVDTAAVRPRAVRLGVGFQPGRAFSTTGGLARHLRLSYAYYGEDDLVAAVGLLGRAFA